MRPLLCETRSISGHLLFRGGGGFRWVVVRERVGRQDPGSRRRPAGTGTTVGPGPSRSWRSPAVTRMRGVVASGPRRPCRGRGPRPVGPRGWRGRGCSRRTRRGPGRIGGQHGGPARSPRRQGVLGHAAGDRPHATRAGTPGSFPHPCLSMTGDTSVSGPRRRERRVGLGSRTPLGRSVPPTPLGSGPTRGPLGSYDGGARCPTSPRTGASHG
jgi:hypothetical protein